MASNLPDGCSQDQIDRLLGGNAPDWVCEDEDCGQGWEGDYETRPCEIDGCDVIGCQECFAQCRACNRTACSEHRLKYDDDGNDKLAFWCLECISEREAEYGESKGEAMDFTRATELTEEVKDAIDDAFEYHKWDDAKVAQGGKVRVALASAVRVIVECVPPSPDRSAAIRKLREARMDCNSAITHDGKY